MAQSLQHRQDATSSRRRWRHAATAAGRPDGASGRCRGVRPAARPAPCRAGAAPGASVSAPAQPAWSRLPSPEPEGAPRPGPGRKATLATFTPGTSGRRGRRPRSVRRRSPAVPAPNRLEAPGWSHRKPPRRGRTEGDHHPVPAPHHLPPRGLRRAGQHRAAGQPGDLRHAGRRHPPRPARPIRGYGNVVALRQQAEQPAKSSRPAARQRAEHHRDVEAPNDSTDEAAVPVQADQRVGTRRRPRMHPAGRLPEGRHQRQPLMPERHHHRCARGVRRHVLRAVQRPARRAQRELKIEAIKILNATAKNYSPYSY